ncbi:M50 family metallopeptidase [Plantactinospora siamensis]|uniref:M50 family metallopeptidase n=1 Tax=Plantactinospora siamensis TaxID=555372 RepID=A0ABV6NZT0_9ACTN
MTVTTSVVTGRQGSGAATVSDPPAGPHPTTTTIPALARGVELIGTMRGSGYRTPPALVRRGDGQTVQLTPLLYHVLAAIDGRRDLASIAASATEASGRLITAENVRTLVEGRLRPLGLLRGADGGEPVVRRSNPLLALRLRFVVSNPRLTRRITAPFAPLFHPVAVLALTAAFLGVAGWVLFDKGLGSATYEAFNRPALLLLLFAVTIVSAGFHEFGHAAACRYGGATPGAMGAGVYLLWPAFYTDVNDSYRLGRPGRLRVDLGGLYFNAIFAVATFGVWAATGWDAVLLLVPAQILQMLRQLAPFVRFDGYHILADLIGVPDLYARIGPTLLALLPHRRDQPQARALKPWARAVVTGWVLVVVPLLLSSLVLLVVAFPRVAGTAVTNIVRHAGALSAAWQHGDAVGVTARALSILATALPLLAGGYMLVSLVRRVGRSVWRHTAGRPVRRATAGVAAVAVLAGLLWAWWPHGDRYAPVRPTDHGAVTDALAIAHQSPPRPAGAGLRPGQVGRAVSVWAAPGAPPTREKPQLSLVMVPHRNAAAPGAAGPAAGEPAWVFPFNKPAPPGEGDNQALAVNTTDGSTAYDVAFAMVWVTDGESWNVNEAYAVASCTGCTTVAVAFQVVLIVGQADIVVPQNLSAAVNYECVDCLTYALASQLLLTLKERPDAATAAKLDALWAQIQQYAANIRDVPLDEIRQQLLAYQAQIVAILKDDLALPSPVPSPPPTPSVTPDDPAPSGAGSTGPSEQLPPVTGPPSVGVTASPSAPGTSPAVPDVPTTLPSPDAAGDPSLSPAATAEPAEPAAAASGGSPSEEVSAG